MTRFALLAVAALLAGCESVDVLGARQEPVAEEPKPEPPVPEEPKRDDLPNVLEERQRIPLSQVKAQLNDAFRQLFFGDPETEAVFFPQEDGTGYIKDIANGDVRTDSMAYGMLVTVQLDQREVFDELWAWTKSHMMSPSGASAGLLRWRCSTSGDECARSAATDASSLIATTLLLAQRRWGSAGAHAYEEDGLALLEALSAIEERNGGVVDGVVNCFDPVTALPRRSSLSPEAETPVDYLMPAFYELWALHDVARSEQWQRAADNARELLSKVAHPTTGLLPEMVTYDGEPLSEHADYRSTTSRALLNMALDHLWFGPHPWVVEQNQRRLDFFLEQGVDTYVAEYTTDGEPLVDYNSPAHRSLVAVAAGTASDERFDVFLERLLEEPIPAGGYRYYDGMLYMLSLLVLSGQMTYR